MNLEYFIAKRLIKGAEHKISISAPIIKIAIAAIALGIIMMLIAIATGVGLKHKVREKVTAFNGHIQIYNYDNNNSDVSVVPIDVEQESFADFMYIEGISQIHKVATKAAVIRTEDTFEGLIAKGVDKDYNWQAFEEFLIEGRLPNFKDDLNNEVLLSRVIANRLQLKTEDTFFTIFFKDDANKVPNQRTFKISGIYDSGFEEFDLRYFFIDIRHIQRMNKWEANQIGNYEITLDDFDAIQEKTLAIHRNTVATLDTQNIERKYARIFDWISLFDFNIALIIGIMVIVAGFNMITALLVLILERTQMIGIFKALGSSNWSIRKIFLYNATYLIGVGLIWGNLIGLGAIWVQDKFKLLKFPNPKEYYIDYVPVHIDFTTIVLLNIGVMVLCLLMLLIPSYIITRITPIKAIKFE